MSRYRKVEQHIWSDQKFCALTPLQPSGQALWFYMLTGPATTAIPGLMKFSIPGCADDLGWSLEDFSKAFQEVLSLGMAKYDRKAKLLWLPKAVKYNKPASAHVVTSWHDQWELLPECDLKREAYDGLQSFIDGLDETYVNAFAKAIRKPSLMALPNQEQKQDQDQDQDQDSLAPTPSGPPPQTSDFDQSELVLDEQPTEKKKNLPAVQKVSDPSKTGPTWDSYANAYKRKYRGVTPLRDAKVNGVLSKFVDRVGAEEAPAIAAFYVLSRDSFYSTKSHPVELLLNDCQKLRTEWLTGRTVTMTTARDNEKTASNPAAAYAMKLRAEEAARAREAGL